jgi:hypothetical protein
VLSKLLLFLIALLLVSKFGLRTKLRQLLPRLDRAVNFTIIGLVLIYLGQLFLWFFRQTPGK